MTARIGPAQRRVLATLNDFWDAPPTPAEIAADIAVRARKRLRPTADVENVGNTLRSLERRGLVERKARTWALTDAGRQVVHELEEAQ